MIKKFFTCLALAMGLVACSVDDLDTPKVGSDGELKVNLVVPAMEQVATRDEFSEDAVNKLDMLIFSSTGLEQVVPASDLDITMNGKKYTVSYTLAQDLRVKRDLKLYFFANLNGITYPPSETELRRMTTAKAWSANDMVMSAEVMLTDVVDGTDVLLKRNGAKVEVRKGADWATATPDFAFDSYGMAAESRIIAGTLTDRELLPDATASSASSFRNEKTASYVNATANEGRDAKNRPFIIIKAPFEGVEYYYRVEFEKVETVNEKTTITKLDVMSNHEYRFLVKDVIGRGEATPEAAAQNPSSMDMLQIEVYDVCPQSYNMITDGIRELGVLHELSHNGNPTDAASNPGSKEYLYIKLYTVVESEYGIDPLKHLSAEASWIGFGTPEEVTDAETLGSASGVAGETKGKVYRVPVDFKTNRTPGNLKSKIKITWMGLSREVPVTWIREFSGKDLCSVSLSIKNHAGTEMAKVNDYWEFLEGNTTPVLYGVKTSQNNDSIRNAGLHFPLAYGIDDNHLWTYSYEVEFEDLNDGLAYNWKIQTTGVKGISVKKDGAILTPTTVNTNTGKLNVSIEFNPESAGWDYEVGKMILYIKATTASDIPANWQPYELSLYHCGFFDRPTKFRVDEQGSTLSQIVNHRVDMSEQDCYYYYEVREGPNGEYYWLDRNLGSQSAAYYIESTGNITYVGDADAAGGYYRAAAYNVGNAPKMYADLCPPGFEIPRVDAWNALRNSTNFTTSQIQNYYGAQFVNKKNQYVYFPRARYYGSDGVKTGESRAGYYWTQTAASGLEKDQIGNWLRYLKFSGSIASYDNAEVQGRMSSNGFAMSVRCVNKTKASDETYRTYFKVSGATHVYLYSHDNKGNRNPVTNWPGQVIGNYQTMGAGQIFSFSYESPNTDPKEFYVMFTFRDENGIWHTISKNTDGSAKYSINERSADLQGWKVIGDDVKDAEGNIEKSALNGTWKLQYDAEDGTASVSFIPGLPIVVPEKPKLETYRVYWSSSSSNPYIYLWNLSVNSLKSKDGTTSSPQNEKFYPAIYDGTKGKYYIEMSAYDNQDFIGNAILMKANSWGNNDSNKESGNLDIKISNSNANKEIYLN